MERRAPGAVTRDGCPVEVYLRLPPGGDPQLIHSVAPHGSILDLGCGVGRIADPLVRLGHHVVAVDDSAEMLNHVREAARVQSSIETLRLGERFDVVLMASHLINAPDRALRASLLATVVRHLATDGHTVIQWHSPEWFDSLRSGQVLEGAIGELHSTLDVRSIVDGLLSAVVSYRTDRDTWTQTFVAQRLTRADIGDELRHAGLELVDHPALGAGWLVARNALARPADLG